MNKDIGLPNGLTFDPFSKLLCWADAGNFTEDGSGYDTRSLEGKNQLFMSLAHCYLWASLPPSTVLPHRLGVTGLGGSQPELFLHP